MTTTSPVETWEVSDIEVLGDEHWHVTCCLKPKFLCMAPFHPDAAAPKDLPEEECCEPCVKIVKDMGCPRGHPTHQHCPFSGRWCPK